MHGFPLKWRGNVTDVLGSAAQRGITNPGLPNGIYAEHFRPSLYLAPLSLAPSPPSRPSGGSCAPAKAPGLAAPGPY